MTEAISDRKNHCMIVHAHYPLGETRVEREALALVDAGYSVDVLCLRNEIEQAVETINGVKVYRLPVRRNKTRNIAGQLLEYLRFFFLAFIKLLVLYPKRRYKTVQAHNLPDFLIFAALVPKMFGTRLILDLHDLMPEFFASKQNRTMESPVVRFVALQEKLSCWFANHVITVTDIWRDRLISRGVPENKVSVVMNVADDRIFYSNPGVQRRESSNGNFHLIYHGTFKRHYGMEDLIKAIQLVSKEKPDIQLTLQGVGEYRDEMIRLVDELGLDKNIQINDFILPTEELPVLIKQADAGVVPNHDDVFNGDLLPTKMMEYIALGVPVLVSRTRVISHYFDEKMVQFFEPGNPESLAEGIIFLSKNKNKLEEMVVHSRKFNEIHNWKAVSKAYVELVERLAMGGSKP